MSQDSTTTSEPFFKKVGDFFNKVDPLEAARKAADTAAKVKQSKDILTNAGKGSSSIPQEKYSGGGTNDSLPPGESKVPYTKYVVYGVAGLAAIVTIVVVVKKMRK